MGIDESAEKDFRRRRTLCDVSMRRQADTDGSHARRSRQAAKSCPAGRGPTEIRDGTLNQRQNSHRIDMTVRSLHASATDGSPASIHSPASSTDGIRDLCQMCQNLPWKNGHAATYWLRQRPHRSRCCQEHRASQSAHHKRPAHLCLRFRRTFESPGREFISPSWAGASTQCRYRN